jgi:hypothetical protein
VEVDMETPDEALVLRLAEILRTVVQVMSRGILLLAVIFDRASMLLGSLSTWALVLATMVDASMVVEITTGQIMVVVVAAIKEITTATIGGRIIILNYRLFRLAWSKKLPPRLRGNWPICRGRNL